MLRTPTSRTHYVMMRARVQYISGAQPPRRPVQEA